MNNDLQLSPHFKRSEFACPCCNMLTINLGLIRALEELRTKMGGRALQVTSGYRCPAHNRAVGGEPNSQHCLGNAADVICEGADLLDFLTMAGTVDAFARSGIGLYPKEGFLHLDVGRTKSARWARVNGTDGKPVYVGLAEGIKAASSHVHT